MVSSSIPAHKPQKAPRLDSRRIRSVLLLQGHTLASWARMHGVSDPLVFRLISGARPGVRGKSGMLKAKLLKLEATR